MKDNFKIAVMLNGHPKHLETTQHLYKHWNNLYDNVEFDFFVSIWDTIDNDYESFGRVLDINELEDMDYLISKLYMENNVEVNSMEIISIVNSINSHENISKTFGFGEEIIYKIKGLCR